MRRPKTIFLSNGETFADAVVDLLDKNDLCGLSELLDRLIKDARLSVRTSKGIDFHVFLSQLRFLRSFRADVDELISLYH